MKQIPLIGLAFFSLISAAYANDLLRFDKPQSYKQQQALKALENQDLSYVIANIDLNNDFIDEYVIRPENMASCPKAPLCPFTIVAFENRKPIIIGTFDAHKMLVSHQKTYGVRHIIVYNQSHNDYTSAEAAWNPFSYRFELL
jgi:hypothetical protein